MKNMIVPHMAVEGFTLCSRSLKLKDFHLILQYFPHQILNLQMIGSFIYMHKLKSIKTKTKQNTVLLIINL